ncbi:hypothetical protein LB505_007131 [Fusarium chuoi]|nr:hypothetical protein LB505_007131 [Fusarium chuoi]
MHYMVREPNQGQAIGFCATFTTFTDSSGDRLIGSVAAIIVHKDFRGQGVGRFLHNEVVSKLNKIRGHISKVALRSARTRNRYGVVRKTRLEHEGIHTWKRAAGARLALEICRPSSS